MRLTRAFLVTVLSCSWLISGSVSAQNHQKETLRGLKGVHVLIETIARDAQRDGLTRSSLQTDVELKLRTAGIRVVTSEERFEEPGWPSLYVNVNALASSTGNSYAYSIRVGLDQEVSLWRKPTIRATATTWISASVGIVGVNRMRAAVRESVSDQVDEFLNNYLAVNPK